MARIALRTRLGISLAAVGITWLISGIAFSIYLRDINALLAFWIWSIPFFAAGWILVGIPVASLNFQHPLTPGSALMVGITGALTGGMIMLAPGAIVRLISPHGYFAPFAWNELAGLPELGAAIGAAGLLLYSWLLSSFVSSVNKSLLEPDSVSANAPDQ